jgi:hypothetical protein
MPARRESRARPRPDHHRGVTVHRIDRPALPNGHDTDGRPNRWRALAAAALLPLAWAGCAQDAWRPDPNFSAFLNKVSQNCGGMRLGEPLIRDLMNPGSPMYSALFLDLTSRFDTGRISEQDYVTNLTGTLRVSANSDAVRCILAQKAAS